MIEPKYLKENIEYNKERVSNFEGEYLYGHKLRGKYYVNNHLEYEGEFLYNKKWNGKGYDEDGNIIYELFNGNGKVKEYIFFLFHLLFHLNIHIQILLYHHSNILLLRLFHLLIYKLYY